MQTMAMGPRTIVLLAASLFYAARGEAQTERIPLTTVLDGRCPGSS
jgi:hypothetical protein